MLTIDPFEIYSVVTGTLGLDGGAMFGVVPKVLWTQKADPDEHNRIPLTTRTLLAVDRSAGRVILVDTGCGTKWSPKDAERFAIRMDPQAIPSALAAIGLSPEDVTDVVIGHLHFDHAGGLTDWVDEPNEETCLRYPSARHWIHRRHWEHASKPHLKDRASFLKQDFAALGEAGVLGFLEGENPDPPFEGLTWLVSHGHTPYQLHPVFGVGRNRLVFAGDLVPTMAHLRPGWVMAYDVLPMTTIDEKQALFRRCLDDGWLIAFPHDPRAGGAALTGRVDRPVVDRALPL